MNSNNISERDIFKLPSHSHTVESNDLCIGETSAASTARPPSVQPQSISGVFVEWNASLWAHLVLRRDPFQVNLYNWYAVDIVLLKASLYHPKMHYIVLDPLNHLASLAIIPNYFLITV